MNLGIAAMDGETPTINCSYISIKDSFQICNTFHISVHTLFFRGAT